MKSCFSKRQVAKLISGARIGFSTISASARVRNWPERFRSARTTAARSVSGATLMPRYSNGMTVIGNAAALPPEISISSACANESAGNSRASNSARTRFMDSTFRGDKSEFENRMEHRFEASVGQGLGLAYRRLNRTPSQFIVRTAWIDADRDHFAANDLPNA